MFIMRKYTNDENWDIDDLECVQGVAKKDSTTASTPTSKEVTGHHREREGRGRKGRGQRMVLKRSERAGRHVNFGSGWSKLNWCAELLMLGNASSWEKEHEMTRIVQLAQRKMLKTNLNAKIRERFPWTMFGNRHYCNTLVPRLSKSRVQNRSGRYH